MFKFLTALALVGLAVPASAAIAPDKVQSIYDTSSKVCPDAVNFVIQGQDPKAVFSAMVIAARKSGYSNEEIALLIDFCLAYDNGAIRVLKTMQ